MLNKRHQPPLNASTKFFRLPLWFLLTHVKDLVMMNDVVMPSNPLITPVEEEKLEEPPLDVNVSQWLRDEEPFQIVVRT